MPDERPQPQKIYYASTSAKPHHRKLKAIRQEYTLHAGGKLIVEYRLLKGANRDANGVSSTYGCHPDTGEIESYFSTQDTAVLELTLINESGHGHEGHSHEGHSLKHLRLSNIHLVTADGADKSPKPVLDKLPDGNLLFELVPNEVYFGHLTPGERAVRYLSLITRGIQDGNYTIKLEVHYDIEQCRLGVDLGLTVRDD